MAFETLILVLDGLVSVFPVKNFAPEPQGGTWDSRGILEIL
jgi:hypothetical protein